jgi:hypothetical protein
MPKVSWRLALAVVSVAPACTVGDTLDASFLTGTYAATVFVVTPVGQAPLNVLAAGGTLSITINSSGTTSGSLNVPASVTGGTAFTASMAGTATITALTVQFSQDADTFVRDLVWSRVGTELQVVNQTAGNSSFTITLTHQ